MTFLYKINKKGATAEGCITASDEAEAKAKLDAKFPKGSGVKVLGLEQVYVATIRFRGAQARRVLAQEGRPDHQEDDPERTREREEQRFRG